MRVERCGAVGPDWAGLREQLWPGSGGAADLAACLARGAVFLVRVDGAAAGFAEVSVRHDYVNGCGESPVAFLEGIFVVPAYRRRGAARALLAAVEGWARTACLAALASDAPVENTASQAMHSALGFAETERVVFYRKLV